MADNNQSFSEMLGINLETLTSVDKHNLIGELLDTLTAQELRIIRDLSNQKRMEKLEMAKQQVIEEMREKFVQLDLNLDDVFILKKPRGRPRGGSQRRQEGKSPLPPRYISPDGETWSGRGTPPKWMKEIESAGGKREEYLIREEG